MSDLVNDQNDLARFLASHPSNDASFPLAGVDYYAKFLGIDKHLNNKVHPLVNQGATAHSARRKKVKKPPPVWLTDHGPEHIATVIQRAADLVCAPECKLTPYETYLLLVAIHFHDVGNIFGREEHEKEITKIMDKIDSAIMGEDAFEKRLIRDIAMAHGGTVAGSGDKDTIGHLKYSRNLALHQPRVRLLAALLRFADELADDHTRTSRFLLDSELIHPDSEIYHIYADRLRKVTVNMAHHAVDLNFELSESVVAKKYRKVDHPKTYLFDEILVRTLKMHKERVYCARFMHPHVHLEQIRVEVKLCSNNYMDEIRLISFTIAEQGYPDTPAKLTKLCPELRGLTGAILAKDVAAKVKAAR